MKNYSAQTFLLPLIPFHISQSANIPNTDCVKHATVIDICISDLKFYTDLFCIGPHYYFG